MNRSLVASARKKLLRRGRALLRASGAGRARADEGALGGMDEGDLAQLQEIHAALERIERGIYGRCDGCQAAVEEQRLEEVPWERQCGACRAADDAMTGAEPAAGALESSRASA